MAMSGHNPNGNLASLIISLFFSKKKGYPSPIRKSSIISLVMGMLIWRDKPMESINAGSVTVMFALGIPIQILNCQFNFGGKK